MIIEDAKYVTPEHDIIQVSVNGVVCYIKASEGNPVYREIVKQGIEIEDPYAVD